MPTCDPRARHVLLVTSSLLCLAAATACKDRRNDAPAAEQPAAEQPAAVAPKPVPPLGAEIVGLGVGAEHSCALLGDGRAVCWGSDAYAALGGSSGPGPAAVPGLPPAAALAVGGHFSCIASREGEMICWGSNDGGTLGGGDAASTGPTIAATDVEHMFVGTDVACAQTGDGAVRCWGDASTYVMGKDPDAGLGEPVVVAGAAGFDALAGSANTVCGRRGSDFVCWGMADFEMLTVDDKRLHQPTVIEALRGASAVAFGDSFTVFVGADGRAAVIGLGPGEPRPAPMPALQSEEALRAVMEAAQKKADQRRVPRPLSDVGPIQQVAAGPAHACLLTEAGVVHCIGKNDRGQLGDGTTQDRQQLVVVGGLPAMRWLAAGKAHTCAADPEAGIYCWGENGAGEVDPASPGGQRTTPVMVAR